tara:strand:+ start:372 stop:1067 length:696 start_codon:yes stop_codon:yes gene_type:complete
MALESSPIVMYGATPTAGFGSVSAACSAGTDGDQIISTGDDSVFLFVTNGVEGQRIYLSKKDKNNFSAPTDLWLNTDGFATGQVVYVTAQSMTSPFSAITTAGTYTLTLDDAFPGGGAYAVYIGVLNSTPTQGQPTECEETGTTYDYPSSFFDKSSDSGNDKQFQPMPDGQGTGEGVLIDRNKNINLDYKMRTSGTPVNQVPFILSGVGPQTLRGRSTSIYKCTTGDGDKE